MKKFIVAMIVVCLSIALCSSAMAQPGYRRGPAPPPPPHHRPVPPPPHHHYRPAPPPPRYYRPVPPPPPRPVVGVPLPPPAPLYTPGYYYPRTGIYYNDPRFGISISL